MSVKKTLDNLSDLIYGLWKGLMGKVRAAEIAYGACRWLTPSNKGTQQVEFKQQRKQSSGILKQQKQTRGIFIQQREQTRGRILKRKKKRKKTNSQYLHTGRETSCR